MFGVDDAVLIALIQAAAMAGTAAYTANNTPKMPGKTDVVPAQGGGTSKAENVFSINTPQKAGATPAPVAPPPNDPMISQLLAIGPPKPGESTGPQGAPAKLADLSYTPGPNGDPYSAGPPAPAGAGQGVNWSDTLKAVPGALATIAPLLAMAQQQRGGYSHVVGAQGGGAGGNMVQGLNLPRRQSMAEILANLPRPRYG